MRFISVFGGVLPFVFCISETFAATEFPTTVPADLLREFTGGTALSDLPDDFPEFVMPEAMLPIGSQQTPGQQKVLLRTSRGGAESQLAIVNALKAVGASWMELAAPGSARQNGFVVPARSLEPVTLCHEEYGIFEVLGEDGIENRVYIRRTALPNGPQRLSCAEQNESRAMSGRLRATMRSPFGEYVPSFDALIPPGVSSAAVAPSAGNDDLLPSPGENARPPLNSPALGIRGVPSGRITPGTPDRAFITQAPAFGPVASRITRSGLQSSGGFIPADGRSMREFRSQLSDAIKAQGWKLDSGWSADDTAASAWLRESEQGNHILLRLRVLRMPEDFYNITYELSELGD